MVNRGNSSAWCHLGFLLQVLSIKTDDVVLTTCWLGRYSQKIHFHTRHFLSIYCDGVEATAYIRETLSFSNHNVVRKTHLQCPVLLRSVAWTEWMEYLTHAGIKVNPCYWKKPLVSCELNYWRIGLSGEIHWIYWTWWLHAMETLSVLLALCEGNPPITELWCFLLY